MGYDLGSLKTDIRQYTGRLSTDQLSNQDLDRYLNNYLHYEFAAEFKLDSNLVPYNFLTVKGQNKYAVPENFTNFVPPYYINGLDFSYYGGNYWNNGVNSAAQYGLNYFFNPSIYYQSVGQHYSHTRWQIGDGTTQGFTQTAQNFGILPESVIITDNVETFTDNGLGVLTGSLGGTGTVTYADGSISVAFNTPPADGTQIWLTYVQYQSGQPQQILNFDGYFQVYPVPDNVYKVSMVGYQMPALLVDANDTPKLQEWGLCIIYGTSKTIFAMNGEIDRAAETQSLYKQQVTLVNRRDIQNTMNRSAYRSS